MSDAVVSSLGLAKVFCQLDATTFDFGFTFPDNSYVLFSCEQNLLPQKNVYDIRIYNEVSYEHDGKSTSAFNFLFMERKDPPNFSIGFKNPNKSGNKIWVSHNAGIDSFDFDDYTEPRSRTLINGIRVKGTDMLSYYLEKLYPKISVTGTLNQVIKTIFDKYSFMKQYKIKTERLTNKIKVTANGSQSIEDILYSICEDEDLHWCVIDNKLYIKRSIVRGKRTLLLHSSYFGRSSITPIWYYDEEAQKQKVVQLIRGACSDKQFPKASIRPGDFVKVSINETPYILNGNYKFLVTRIVYTFNGAHFNAIIEGLVMNSAEAVNHEFRKIMNKGRMNPLKRKFKIENYARNYHKVRRSVITGRVFSSSNGLYEIDIGYSSSRNEKSRALQSGNPSLRLSDVPLSTAFGNVGANSSVFPLGTKVVMLCNDDDLSDPIIIGIVDEGTNLPYVKINGITKVMEIEGTQIKLGANATKKLTTQDHIHTFKALIPGPPEPTSSALSGLTTKVSAE